MTNILRSLFSRKRGYGIVVCLFTFFIFWCIHRTRLVRSEPLYQEISGYREVYLTTDNPEFKSIIQDLGPIDAALGNELAIQSLVKLLKQERLGYPSGNITTTRPEIFDFQAGYSYVLVKSIINANDQISNLSIYFQQYYQGIPTSGSIRLVRLLFEGSDRLSSLESSLAIIESPAKTIIPPSEISKIANQYANSHFYLRNFPRESSPQLLWLPPSSTSNTSRWTLIYRTNNSFEVETAKGTTLIDLVMDATSGEFIRKCSLIDDGDQSEIRMKTK